MKKVIDVKIITSPMGIPNRESFGEMEWRLANGKGTPFNWPKRRNAPEVVETIDTNYEDVTDLRPLTELDLEKFNFASGILIKIGGGGSETEDINYTDITDEPQHIAFLGHPLNSK